MNSELKGLQTADIETLCKEHSVRSNTIRKLLDGGVNPDDIDEVLNIREFLSDELVATKIGKIRTYASVNSILMAYKAVDGDTEILGELAEKAHGYAEEIGASSSNSSRNLLLASFSIGLQTATGEYLRDMRHSGESAIPINGLNDDIDDVTDFINWDVLTSRPENHTPAGLRTSMGGPDIPGDKSTDIPVVIRKV